MREVSAKVVGSVVLVFGAMAALAAGVLLPVLGGFGFAGTGLWPAAGPTGSTIESGRDKPADVQVERDSASTPPPARRARLPKLSGAVAAAARVPADTDMVLVVEKAAELRSSRVGEAAVRFLVDAAGMGQTRASWTELASELGWSESEMFDRLLGERVVLVARGFGDPATARWALLSDVSTETDRRLKERLQASQRGIDNGHQILSIEKGKFELTSHIRARVKGDDAEPADGTVGGARWKHPQGDDVTIVLGPAGRSELFDEMVGVLARGTSDALASHEVVAAAAKSGSPEILLLARLEILETAKPAAAIPNDRWGDFFVLSGGRKAAGKDRGDGSEFLATVVYRDRSERETNLAIAPSSDAVFRALEPGSLLSIVQAAPVQQILGDRARLLDTLRDLPLPEPALGLLAPRQVVSLREVEATSGAAGASATVSAVLALETISTTQLAPIIDGSISRFIKEREQQFGIQRPAPRDFGGRLPAVTRVLPLEVPDGNPLRIFVPDPLTLAWSFPAIRDVGGGGEAAQSVPGWWVMSISPSPHGFERLPEDVHNRVALAISRPSVVSRDTTDRRWIWLGSMQPAAVESLLPGTALVPDAGGFRSAMKRFQHLRIELSISDEGDIQGDLVARLAETRVK